MKYELKTKPSLLYIFTGLGRYSWYKLPFIRNRIFCASLPYLAVSYAKKFLRLSSGSCKCRNASCKYIKIYRLKIGLCKNKRRL